jgi:hypothetical protein
MARFLPTSLTIVIVLFLILEIVHQIIKTLWTQKNAACQTTLFELQFNASISVDQTIERMKAEKCQYLLAETFRGSDDQQGYYPPFGLQEEDLASFSTVATVFLNVLFGVILLYIVWARDKVNHYIDKFVTGTKA